MTTALAITSWFVGSCVSAELLGYWLHRLLHSGVIGFLSRSHMKHHLVLYGPMQEQRSKEYLDSTDGEVSLGNIGAEWLLPVGLMIALACGAFRLLHIPALYQLTYFVTTLAWSFLMFSWLHDVMHVEGFWLEKNLVLKRWFLGARQRHDIHHRAIDNRGLMHKNFGIGFFWFDRLFGTFSPCASRLNHGGYRAARQRFKSVLR
jgi:sterol desaturase/sphingolipid hydroxylase (fatty acid hydroxylase superfamily)